MVKPAPTPSRSYLDRRTLAGAAPFDRAGPTPAPTGSRRLVLRPRAGFGLTLPAGRGAGLGAVTPTATVAATLGAAGRRGLRRAAGFTRAASSAAWRASSVTSVRTG